MANECNGVGVNPCTDPIYTEPITPEPYPNPGGSGGGAKLVDSLPNVGEADTLYVLVDDASSPSKSLGEYIYKGGWVMAAQPASETVKEVDVLPEEGEEGVLYYVPKTGTDTYDLYRWINNDWIKVDTDITLYSSTGQNTDGSMTQKAVTDALGDKQDTIDASHKISADNVDDSSTTNKFVTATDKTNWSGKQDAIDSSHKLSADLVDDSGADNKFVTASDKTTWNGKQDAIDSSHKLNADLVDDTNSDNKFVTASDKTTWNGKQDTIDSSHKLDADLVDDTNSNNKFMTAAESTKLNGIEAGAEANVLESVSLNGVAVPITQKNADIPMPVINGHNAAPTPNTVGEVGTLYIYVDENKVAHVYVCVDIDMTDPSDPFYVWSDGNQYTILFDTNGGDPPSIDPVQVISGGRMPHPEDPVMEGKYVAGWTVDNSEDESESGSESGN